MWLFKFNHYSFVFEPGVSIWPGYFSQREKILHSVCIKLRKEIGDQKLLSIDIVDNDRTVVFQFKNNYKLILELYSKGNILLLDKTNTIVILTRIYPECSHGKQYTINKYKVKLIFILFYVSILIY